MPAHFASKALTSTSPAEPARPWLPPYRSSRNSLLSQYPPSGDGESLRGERHWRKVVVETHKRVLTGRPLVFPRESGAQWASGGEGGLARTGLRRNDFMMIFLSIDRDQLMSSDFGDQSTLTRESSPLLIEEAVNAVARPSKMGETGLPPSPASMTRYYAAPRSA
jgi:hypothetical protein